MWLERSAPLDLDFSVRLPTGVLAAQCIECVYLYVIFLWEGELEWTGAFQA